MRPIIHSNNLLGRPEQTVTAQAVSAGEGLSQGEHTTREKIVRVALEAFTELGFDGASTRAIAARAGVNQGLIPYYFGNKLKLWQESVDWAFAALRAGLAGFEVGDDALDDRARLEVLLRRYVHFVSRHTEFVRLMNEEGKRDGPRTEWLVERHVRPLYERLSELFERAAQAGQLTPKVDPLHFHYIFVGAVSAIFHQAPECRLLTGVDPCDPDVTAAHADVLVDLFLGPDPTAREESS
jgi:AcrR family transcriptional regulator